ncbi:hypothetical protein L218DRAFT_1077672 [Marasmius fiardii PR-910]|nr:hypothetical protein L218DRAFT_1077672 [Marasmius fiardii PR-910]
MKMDAWRPHRTLLSSSAISDWFQRVVLVTGDDIWNNRTTLCSCTAQTGPKGDATFAIYCTFKAACFRFALTNELKKDNIRVNCICPEFVTMKLNAPGGETILEGAKVLTD